MAENDFLVRLNTAQLKEDARGASLILSSMGDAAEAEAARIDNAYWG
jgi:hypothetical protein